MSVCFLKLSQFRAILNLTIGNLFLLTQSDLVQMTLKFKINGNDVTKRYSPFDKNNIVVGLSKIREPTMGREQQEAIEKLVVRWCQRMCNVSQTACKLVKKCYFVCFSIAYQSLSRNLENKFIFDSRVEFFQRLLTILSTGLAVFLQLKTGSAVALVGSGQVSAKLIAGLLCHALVDVCNVDRQVMLIRAKINCINVTAARYRLIHREVLRFPASSIAQILRNETLPFVGPMNFSK